MSSPAQRLLNLLSPAVPLAPKQWLRAAVGAALGLCLAGYLCSLAYGPGIALHVLGPLAASAVLVFAVHSGPLAQPWPVFGSYAVACVIGLLLRHAFGAELAVAAGALGLSLVAMCALRCLHPPGGAVAVSVVLADPGLLALGDHVLAPVLLNVVILLAVAVVFNHLTGVQYPKRAAPGTAVHHTRDPLPSERVGVTAQDLDQALSDIGEYIDVSRDDLERIIQATEQQALRRSLGGVTAEAVMARDVQFASPDTTLEQAWALLSAHRLKTLPVLQQGRLVGIVSLSDLVAPAMARGRFSWRGAFTRRPLQLAQIMSREVVSVRGDAPLAQLLPLLCEQGLHCLPVLEADRLVGVITQTDLIAGLRRQLLDRPAAASRQRVPAL